MAILHCQERKVIHKTLKQLVGIVIVAGFYGGDVFGSTTLEILIPQFAASGIVPEPDSKIGFTVYTVMYFLTIQLDNINVYASLIQISE